MKKLILFLTILLTGITLSSCLEGSEAQFSGSSDFAYITKDKAGLVVARIFNRGQGGLITSPEIKQMTPGEFKFMTYSWTESMGTVTSNGYVVYNAQVAPNSVDIPRTALMRATPPVIEDPNYFLMQPAAYDSGPFFDDNWLIEYTYKKGENASLQFYLYGTSSNPDEYIIDVRMVKAAASTGNEVVKDYIVVDLSDIREMYPPSGDNAKEITLKFRYYRDGQTGLFTTSAYKMVVATT